MQALPASLVSSVPRFRPRTAVVASADGSFRQRLSEILTGLRWQVREAEGGAQAWAEAEATPPEAIIVDSWLPDLEMAEFLKDFRGTFPQVDLVTAGSSSTEESPRGPYRQELLYALRRSQDTDTAVWNTAPALKGLVADSDRSHANPRPVMISGNKATTASTPQNPATAPIHSQAGTRRPASRPTAS
jgi:CheY-like chemotaxis protein